MKKEKEKKQKKQRRNLQLKENIYNSPYLILILLTSLAVMVCSDEIGFGAIPEQAQIFVWDAYAKMPGKQDISIMDSSSSFISEPRERKISFITSTSRSAGTSRIIHFSSAKIADAISGSTAFFAPLITTDRKSVV